MEGSTGVFIVGTHRSYIVRRKGFSKVFYEIRLILRHAHASWCFARGPGAERPEIPRARLQKLLTLSLGYITRVNVTPGMVT